MSLMLKLAIFIGVREKIKRIDFSVWLRLSLHNASSLPKGHPGRA
jgi:hypothetical protein